MRIFVNLSDTEAAAASKGELRTLIRPLKEQPPEGLFEGNKHTAPVTEDGSFGIWTRATNGIHYPSWSIPLQFHVGTELWARETHRPAVWPPNTWKYKADCPPDYTGWWSPVTAPLDAIRHKWTVKSNRVCLASEISREEQLASTWRFPIDTWQKRYPKLDFEKTWVEVIGV